MEQVKKYEYLDETFYTSIKELLEQARKRIYRNINSEMVLTYWQIGKMIVEKQGREDRAKYGDNLIKELSVQLTKDFGKGFTERNLWTMRQFYLLFPIMHAVRTQLSWTHYRLLIGVKNKKAREFYYNESIKANWSTRQLEREINTFSYQRYISSNMNYDVVEDTAKRESPNDIKNIIKDILKAEYSDEDFIKDKFDSLMFIRLVVTIEKEFGIEIDLSKINIQNFDTIEKICEFVEENKNEN